MLTSGYNEIHDLPPPNVKTARIDMNVGRVAVGLTLLIASTVAAVIVYRHLDRPDNPGLSAGTAMMLLIINLIQLLALAITLIAMFDSPV
jgi:hypothetical protein